MSDPFPQDPYLSGGYAPFRSECDCADLVIEGQIPEGLAGTFYRIGPNPQFAPRPPYNPLDADGMVQAFVVKDGRVAYRNRWVRTRRWTLERAAGRALFGPPGDPRASDPSVAGLPTDGVANTHLAWHGGRLLALEEGHAPIEIDPRSLETRGVWTFDGRLPRNMTAHPKIDPRTGEMWFFANLPGGRLNGDIGLYAADASGALVWSTVIQGPWAAMVHDFAVTQDYVIVPVCPATLSLERARSGGPLIAWEPERGVQVAVIPRYGQASDVRWFEAPAAMVWHLMNAFNQGPRIVVDLCQQDAAMFPAADGAAPDEAQGAQRLTRWTLDLASGEAFAAERLSETICEYPRIDERGTGSRRRFGYVACHGGPGTGDIFHRGLGVIDLETRDMHLYRAAPGQAVAEPVFVPRAPDAPEGDGYLMTNIYDDASQRSFLAVFDATAVGAGPIAKAWLDHRAPVGFHGLWLPDQALPEA